MMNSSVNCVPEGRVVRRISDLKSISSQSLLVVLLVAVFVSMAWLTDRRTGVRMNGIADAAAPREWIETRGSWIPTTTNDWLERLNGDSTLANKRGGGSFEGRQSQRKYAPPSGVTRIPGVGSNQTERPSAKPAIGKAGRGSSGVVKKTAASKSNDDSEDEDESPWTKEESRGTYRTLCVRMCDGYYFPISFATTKDNFARDAKVCERSCKSPARLFFHENPGQAPDDMEDAKGKRYKDLKVAFSHQKQYEEACSCKAQPWDEAALARHRQFAEAADRKKGGKKAVDAQAKDGQPSQAKEQTESALPVAVLIPSSLGTASQSTPSAAHRGGNEVKQGLLPAPIAELGLKRRQSIAPARLARNLKLSPQRAVSLFQTPVGAGRLPRQSRPWMSVGDAEKGIADTARTVPRNSEASAGSGPPANGGPGQPKKASTTGQSASTGAPLSAATPDPHTTAIGKKVADGAETQVR
jgi:hypothetical protein